MLTWSGGGTDVGCDSAEFGCGDGPALPGEPTDGIAVRDSGIECGAFREYDIDPPPGVWPPAGGAAFGLENIEKYILIIEMIHFSFCS